MKKIYLEYGLHLYYQDFFVNFTTRKRFENYLIEISSNKIIIQKNSLFLLTSCRACFSTRKFYYFKDKIQVIINDH